MLKKCFVPSCSNNSQDSPLKLFLSVPKPDNRRKLWFKSVGANYRSSRSVFCCEDHFNLPVDAKNWVYFKTVGGRIILHEHVVPHLNLKANSQVVDYSQLSSSEKKLKSENIKQIKHVIKDNLVTELSNSKTLEKVFQNTSKEIATIESPASILVGFLVNDSLCFVPHQNNSSDSNLLPIIVENNAVEYSQNSNLNVEIFYEKSISNVKNEICNEKNELNNFQTILVSKNIKSSPVNGEIINQKCAFRLKRRRKSPIRVKHDFSDDDITSSEYIQNVKIENEKSSAKINRRLKSPICVKIEDENDENDFHTVCTPNYIHSTSLKGEVIYHKNTVDVEKKKSPIYVKNETYGNDVNNFQLLAGNQIKIEEQLNTELIIKEEVLSVDENEGSYIQYDPSELIENENTHIKKLHVCNICKKTFKRKSRFNKHMKKHTEQPWYSCDICHKTFAMQHYLIAHERMHIGERPYKCDVCAKQFIQKRSLVIHERKHTGEKPYSCDFCDKSFAHKSYLTSHKRTHTGEKPYKCDICETHFSYLSTLRVHKQKHTGERPFSCDVCHKTFTKRPYLVIHKIQHIGSNLWVN